MPAAAIGVPVPKIYAWVMRVTKQDGTTEELTRVAPTENQARRRAARKGVQAIEILRTYTEAQYHAVYGYKRRFL